jgi:hypothetical protein
MYVCHGMYVRYVEYVRHVCMYVCRMYVCQCMSRSRYVCMYVCMSMYVCMYQMYACTYVRGGMWVDGEGGGEKVSKRVLFIVSMFEIVQISYSGEELSSARASISDGSLSGADAADIEYSHSVARVDFRVKVVFQSFRFFQPYDLYALFALTLLLLLSPTTKKTSVVHTCISFFNSSIIFFQRIVRILSRR